MNSQKQKISFADGWYCYTYRLRNSRILFKSCGKRAAVLINEPLAKVVVIFRKVAMAFAEYGIHQASGKMAM